MEEQKIKFLQSKTFKEIYVFLNPLEKDYIELKMQKQRGDYFYLSNVEDQQINDLL